MPFINTNIINIYFVEVGKSKLLLWVASLVLPITYVILQLSVELWEKPMVIWLFCVIFSLFFLNQKSLKEIYWQNNRGTRWWSLFALIPAVGTLFVAFIPAISAFTPFAFLLWLIVAVCKGLAEELFWRGTLSRHLNPIKLGFLCILLYFLVSGTFLWLV